ncbi:hypothetical protein DPMN_160243 [Dreissena polymorpha]|uniref:Uncharacterized protein n=1 Tax=Dreissena polymorpha TaxID=45954 RepID=A0A9D4ISC8_DREPO|nr:hypothetical protein DPMN_160243 [Dreissena polymorpha]
MKKYEELLKLSQDPEKCDRQTDSQTDAQSANHKSPPLKPEVDNKTETFNNAVCNVTAP